MKAMMVWALLAIPIPPTVGPAGPEGFIDATYPTEAICNAALADANQKYDIWLQGYNNHLKSHGLPPIEPLTRFECRRMNKDEASHWPRRPAWLDAVK